MDTQMAVERFRRERLIEIERLERRWRDAQEWRAASGRLPDPRVRALTGDLRVGRHA